jgi:hypothetical protein
MPWADHIRSYRGVALQLQAAIPAGAGCIAQSDLAPPQRAALSYHAGNKDRAAGTAAAAAGPEVPVPDRAGPSAQEFRLARAGASSPTRPAGDRGERYRLYRYGTK